MKNIVFTALFILEINLYAQTDLCCKCDSMLTSKELIDEEIIDLSDLIEVPHHLYQYVSCGFEGCYFETFEDLILFLLEFDDILECNLRRKIISFGLRDNY